LVVADGEGRVVLAVWIMMNIVRWMNNRRGGSIQGYSSSLGLGKDDAERERRVKIKED